MIFRAMFVAILLAGIVAAEPVKLAGASAEPPKEWVKEKPKYTLRSHQFKLKSEKEGVSDAEVIVSQQVKADPEKVFPGFKSQFEPPDGKTIDDVSKVSKIEVGATTIHLLDVTGTWKYRERPNDPKSKEERRENWRLILAIVIVKDEAAHVRFSGPADVVAKYHDGFEKWLKSVK